MRDLNFIPFGAQYYRAPTPLEKNWKRDLTAFKQQGFNTVKLWAQWGWNMPAENEFDFSDLHRLMDLCAERDIKVVINIIYDVMPHWFYVKYPDSVMVTADDRKLFPQSTAWRQIGGAPGPCLHHPEGIACRAAFTEAVASHFADHPALLCWDLWNEPELTCGIVRTPEQQNIVCYCDHSVSAFRDWLQEKYGTLSVLNDHWGRNYRHWDEIQPPRNGMTYNDMIDWRAFFAESLAGELHMRSESVRQKDKTHPVMVHSVPGFDYLNACADDYLLSKEVDWYGDSSTGSPVSVSRVTGVPDCKWVINAEIHAIGGNSMTLPKTPTFEEMKRHILIPLGGGIKGFLYWQYRPEKLGWESPAWGLTKQDGSPTPWLEQARCINDAIQKNTDKLLNAFPRKPRVAVVRSTANDTLLWTMDPRRRMGYYSVEGAYMACYCANIPAAIISENQLMEEGLDSYDVVYYPLPYYIERCAAERVKDFVEQGGTLISEALFGAFDSDSNLYTDVLPGYGFDRIFGCVEDYTTTATVFNNAYEGNWATVDESKETVLFQSESGDKVGGFFFRQVLAPDTANPIAHYENGEVAAVENRYGKGRAILIGTWPSFLAGSTHRADSRAYIAELMQRYGGQQPIAVMDNGRHCDVLYREGTPTAVVLQWYGTTDRRIIFSDLAMRSKKLVNPIEGDILTVDADGICVVPDGGDACTLYIVED